MGEPNVDTNFCWKIDSLSILEILNRKNSKNERTAIDNNHNHQHQQSGKAL